MAHANGLGHAVLVDCCKGPGPKKNGLLRPEKRDFLIGSRRRDVDLFLPDVAGHHAVFRFNALTKKWTVKDVSNDGGVKVNRRFLKPNVVRDLVPNDVIKIGGAENNHIWKFQFRSAAPESPSLPAGVESKSRSENDSVTPNRSKKVKASRGSVDGEAVGAMYTTTLIKLRSARSERDQAIAKLDRAKKKRNVAKNELAALRRKMRRMATKHEEERDESKSKFGRLLGEAEKKLSEQAKEKEEVMAMLLNVKDENDWLMQERARLGKQLEHESGGGGSAVAVAAGFADGQPVELVKRFGEELMCTICNELLIDAAVLVCGHNFCKHCIEQWRNSTRAASISGTCPNCRRSISSLYPSSCLDNLVEVLSARLGDEAKSERGAVIQERKVQQRKQEEDRASTRDPDQTSSSSVDFGPQDDYWHEDAGYPSPTRDSNEFSPGWGGDLVLRDFQDADLAERDQSLQFELEPPSDTDETSSSTSSARTGNESQPSDYLSSHNSGEESGSQESGDEPVEDTSSTHAQDGDENSEDDVSEVASEPSQSEDGEDDDEDVDDDDDDDNDNDYSSDNYSSPSESY